MNTCCMTPSGTRRDIRHQLTLRAIVSAQFEPSGQQARRSPRRTIGYARTLSQVRSRPDTWLQQRPEHSESGDKPELLEDEQGDQVPELLSAQFDLAAEVVDESDPALFGAVVVDHDLGTEWCPVTSQKSSE